MPKMIQAASMDAFRGGKGYGSVAAALVANGFNVCAMRTNDVLRKEEWKSLDEKVVQISRERLVGVNDLISRGLVHDLAGQGLGTTVLEHEDASDMTDASMSMGADEQGRQDRIVFDIKALPLPITHKEFKINLRVREASRKKGEPLDTTQVGIATRKVAELVEYTLFNGASAYTFGGGTIRGYTDHPNRNTVSLTTNWDDSPSDGESILDDVLAMKQAAIDAKHYGPFMLYPPTNYDTVLDEDFKANGTITTRERLKEVAGIEDVKVADKLADDNVVLVELAEETARIVNGLDPTVIEWDAKGGLVQFFKVITILVPQIRADQDGNSGIVHLS